MSKLLAFVCLGLMALGSAAAQDASGLPDGPGKSVVVKMCTACHGAEQFSSRRATPDEWSSIVQLMVSRGAEGSDADIVTVTKYLSVTFPPQTNAPPASAPAVPPAAAPPASAPAQTPPASRLLLPQAGRPVLNASAAVHSSNNVTRYFQLIKY